jgi:hypothetical protein
VEQQVKQTWEERNLPILIAIYEAEEEGRQPSLDDVAAATGLERSFVQRTLRALSEDKYIDGASLAMLGSGFEMSNIHLLDRGRSAIRKGPSVGHPPFAPFPQSEKRADAGPESAAASSVPNMVVGGLAFLGFAVAFWIGAAALDPESPWDPWLIAGGVVSTVICLVLLTFAGVRALRRGKGQRSRGLHTRVRETILTKLSHDGIVTFRQIEIETESDRSTVHEAAAKLEAEGRISVKGEVIHLTGSLRGSSSMVGNLTVVGRPEPGWRAEASYIGSYATFGRGVILGAENDAGRELDDLRCRVEGPDGTTYESVENALGLEASRYHFPGEFEPKMSRPWPEGSYRVTWWGETNDIVNDETVFVAETQFSIVEGGRFDLSHSE